VNSGNTKEAKELVLGGYRAQEASEEMRARAVVEG